MSGFVFGECNTLAAVAHDTHTLFDLGLLEEHVLLDCRELKSISKANADRPVQHAPTGSYLTRLSFSFPRTRLAV